MQQKPQSPHSCRSISSQSDLFLYRLVISEVSKRPDKVHFYLSRPPGPVDYSLVNSSPISPHQYDEIRSIYGVSRGNEGSNCQKGEYWLILLPETRIGTSVPIPRD